MMGENERIGSQIRVLRDRADETQSALATALDLDVPAISRIESGERQLRASELSKVANHFGVSQLAILEPESLLARLPIAPRASGSTLGGDVLRRLTYFADLDNVLSASGHVVPSKFGDLTPSGDWSFVSEATDLASRVLDRLNPLGDGEDRLAALAESIERELGIDVVISPLGESNAMGASITDSAFPLIMVNSDQLRTRALFTLAHELGHVLFADGEVISIDHDLAASSTPEKRANAFAAALLMPEESVRESIEPDGLTAESFARMILKFGVSLESLVYRLQNLAVINSGGREAILDLGWTGLLGDLSDDETETVRRLLIVRSAQAEKSPPTWLAIRALAGLRDGAVGAAPLAGLLGIDVDDIIERVPLAEAPLLERIDYSNPPDLPSVTESSFGSIPV